MDLRLTGGAHDGGFDMMGTWWGSTEVGVQCKSHWRKGIGVVTVREMEGSIAAFCDRSKGDMVGVICSHSGFSKFAVMKMKQSGYPMVLVDFNFDRRSIVGMDVNHQFNHKYPDFIVTKQRANSPAIFYHNEILTR